MTFKPLNENDAVSTRTLLHEAIPLTGSIISGSYLHPTTLLPGNLKTYAHGMFQTVYDYPYLSSSANHVFDATCGVSSQTNLTVTSMASKKRNIYGQMSQLLSGYDATGSVQLFDADGDFFAVGQKMKEVFVLPFSRLLVKDEIKKETFEMKVSVTDWWSAAQPAAANADIITISDVGAATEYRVNSPAGEYGILYAPQNVGLLDVSATDHIKSIGGIDHWRCGLIYYQAGIVVLTGSIFSTLTSAGAGLDFYDGDTLDAALAGDTIDDLNAGLLHRIKNVQFNNTTELNSTVYFCRVNHNEFNYSSNPTYLENSRIKVKTQSTDEPVSYITTVGLYNDRNELLATAKLSESLKKSPSTEFTIRARLDY
tara:strand:- start:828 stop:1934 length:1107 start_codon:yes stop_codon:yes gene_type:complete